MVEEEGWPSVLKRRGLFVARIFWSSVQWLRVSVFWFFWGYAKYMDDKEGLVLAKKGLSIGFVH